MSAQIFLGDLYLEYLDENEIKTDPSAIFNRLHTAESKLKELYPNLESHISNFTDGKLNLWFKFNSINHLNLTTKQIQKYINVQKLTVARITEKIL